MPQPKFSKYYPILQFVSYKWRKEPKIYIPMLVLVFMESVMHLQSRGFKFYFSNFLTQARVH